MEEELLKVATYWWGGKRHVGRLSPDGRELQPLALGKDAVNSGDTGIPNTLDAVAHRFGGQGRFLGDGEFLTVLKKTRSRPWALAGGKEPEANAVFVELAPATVAALATRGWHFYRFIGEHGYRLMCSWATAPEAVDRFAADLRASVQQ